MVKPDPSRYMGNYEKDRMKRYQYIIVRCHYGSEDIKEAYLKWANAPKDFRDSEWNTYCDIRDGVPIGTNEDLYFKKITRIH